MQTISGEKSRSISDQSGAVSYFMSISMNDTQKRCDFGISGISGAPLFRMQSGKIYDPDNRFAWSYNKNENINIVFRTKEDRYDYTINKIPLAVGQPITQNKYTNFYIKTYDNAQASFDLFVSGNQPSVSGVTVASFGSGEVTSGAIVNSTPLRRFRILSGSISGDGVYGFSVSGWDTNDISNTGYVYINTPTTPRSAILPLLLHTNYGTVSYSLTARSLYFDPSPASFNVSVSGFRSRDFAANTTGEYIFTSTSETNVDANVTLKYFTGPSTFSGVWELFTGTNQNNLVNFRTNNWYVAAQTGYINHTGNITLTGYGSFHVRVVYSGAASNFDPDLATLTFSGSSQETVYEIGGNQNGVFI